MTTNLVAAIRQSLTPDMIAKIAALLGLDRGAVQKAVGAGVPAILASFATLTSSPEGARQLSGTLAQQPAGAFDRFRNAIGGGSGQATLAESGAGLMSGLIGSGGLNALAAAIGSFAGIGTQNATSLIGMLGPVVAGALGHEQRSAGLDADGLASLLASQKDRIAAAMPPGFTKTLSVAGVLDTVGGGLRGTAAAAPDAGAHIAGAAGDATAGAAQAAYADGGGAAPRTWPLWALGVAALVGFGLYLSGHDSWQLAERQATTATPPGATVGSRTPDIATAAELKSELSASVSAVRVAILGMTNAATANAALPQLKQAAARLDRVNGMVEELPPGARQGVAAALAPTAARLNQLFDKILSSPEVAGVAKPTVDEVRSKLAALSTR